MMNNKAAKRIAEALEQIATGLEEILKRDDEFDYSHGCNPSNQGGPYPVCIEDSNISNQDKLYPTCTEIDDYFKSYVPPDDPSLQE